MATEEMNSFDREDNIIKVPESSRKEQAVSIHSKVLETKKELRKVLPEEEYVENLEKIIVRDYFPELPKLQAQSEYLEAVARNDHRKIRELQIRYSTTRRRTDRRTSPSARPFSPSVFDPDSPGPSTDDGLPYANKDGDNELLFKKKKSSATDKLTVQSYLDRYTSEDNASFEELAQLQNKRERVRNAWMYEAEKRHNESLVYRRPLPIAAADEQLLAIANGEDEKPSAIDNWAYKARNTVLFNVSDEAPLTMAEYIERSKQNEKIINKEATRFNTDVARRPRQSIMARAALQQAANHAGHVDVTGKELGVVGRSTLGVIATPSPAPGIDESPLMTWGEIEGTPFRLDAPDISPALGDAPVFKIPELPARERIAQDIADQIARRYHGKRRHALDQIQKIAPKTPSFNSSRSSGKLAVMSPAARRFATDKLGIRIGTDKMIKRSPMSKTPQTPRLFSPAIYRMVKVKKDDDTSKPTSSITDNLFNLPPSPLPDDNSERCSVDSEKAPSISGSNRPKAADFF